MATCPSCSAAVELAARFCPACGTALDLSSGGTVQRPPERPPSSGSIDHGRFVPGTLFGTRYRIVSRVGRGGMGEVFRADDLKLGQPVALKLLPHQFAGSDERRARLLAEVRMARQIAHPNVCRVYDVGEIDGENFITMEYVAGEDLAALLQRIGRLPKDKGIEIARQICSGLSAAHERGILHRDLKPANIMLDERGKVRITDFGLAAMAEDAAVNAGEGTPAYMAPEQLAGREATARSDVYALGLVLYELFTGKRAFQASSIAELREMREQRSLTDPSRIVEDIDPAVERVILRCLENDPLDRPASVTSVAAALPGGDPLAAALAAGETPSPELLASAGDNVGLKPSIAIPLLAVILLGIAGVLMIRTRTDITAYVDLELPADALELKARETLAQMGYDGKPVDTAAGFIKDLDFIRSIQREGRSERRWDRLRGGPHPAVMFWYRESSSPLEFTNLFGGMVTRTDPPPLRAGMREAVVDPKGRLVSLHVVPDRFESTPFTAGAPDWSPLFAAAGLDPAEFRAVASKWVPPVYADARAAWEPLQPEGRPVRIEAASFRGRPVYFQVIAPWTRPPQSAPVPVTRGQRVGQGVQIGLFAIIIIGAIAIARRNVTLGRGDRRGAVRLAVAVIVLHTAGGLFHATHVPTAYEFGIIVMVVSFALLIGSLTWLLYLALEPYIRRRWPHALISWGKVLAGRVRDPLVGRDLLVGIAAFVMLEFVLRIIVVAGIVSPNLAPGGNLNPLADSGHSIEAVLSNPVYSLGLSLLFTFIVFLLRVILRRDWLAYGATVAIFTALGMLMTEGGAEAAVGNLLFGATLLFLIARFGLVAAFGAMVAGPAVSSGVVGDLTAWYAYSVWIPVASLVALALFAFYTSLAGRPLFREALLES